MTDTRTHTTLLPLSEENDAETVIGAEGENAFASHAQRLRVRRLRWLYRFIEENHGLTGEDLRYMLMARFGLSSRTSGEYIRTLAGAHLIVNEYGRWVSRKQFFENQTQATQLATSPRQKSAEH